MKSTISYNFGYIRSSALLSGKSWQGASSESSKRPLIMGICGSNSRNSGRPSVRETPRQENVQHRTALSTRRGGASLATTIPSHFQRNEEPMPPQILDEFLTAIAKHLKQSSYAVLGGAALAKLGMSRRHTADINLILSAETSQSFRERLLTNGDPRWKCTQRQGVG